MSMLEDLKDYEAKHDEARAAEMLSSRIPALERQLVDMVAQQEVLASQQRAQHSIHTELGDQLSQIKRSLTGITETMAADPPVQLANGARIRQSDMEAIKLMQKLDREFQKVSISLDNMEKTVAENSAIKIDTAALSNRAISALDQQIKDSVRQSLGQLHRRLASFEKRASETGAAQIKAATAATDHVISKAEAATSALDTVEGRVRTLNRAVGWTAAGRLSLALLPLAVVIIVLGTLTAGIAQVLGVGPIMTWAWTEFTTAATPTAKILIALGTLTGVTLFAGLVFLGGKKLAALYQGW